MKKDDRMFYVPMGNFNGAEVCELVGLYILNDLCKKYGKKEIGQYSDGKIAIIRNIWGQEADTVRKDIASTFKKPASPLQSKLT